MFTERTWIDVRKQGLRMVAWVFGTAESRCGVRNVMSLHRPQE